MLLLGVLRRHSFVSREIVGLYETWSYSNLNVSSLNFVKEKDEYNMN